MSTHNDKNHTSYKASEVAWKRGKTQPTSHLRAHDSQKNVVAEKPARLATSARVAEKPARLATSVPRSECLGVSARPSIYAVLATVFVLVVMLLAIALPQQAYANLAAGGAFGDGSVTWLIEDDGTLVIKPTDGSSGLLPNSPANWWVPQSDDVMSAVYPWQTAAIRPLVTGIRIEDGVAALGDDPGDATDELWKNEGQLRFMFYGLTNLVNEDGTRIDLSGLDATNVDVVNDMFRGCTNLKNATVNAKNFGPKQVNRMFQDCTSLESVTLGTEDDPIWLQRVETLQSSDNTKQKPFSGITNVFLNCPALTTLSTPGVDDGGAAGAIQRVTAFRNFVNAFCSANNNLKTLEMQGANLGRWLSENLFKNDNLETVDLSRATLNTPVPRRMFHNTNTQDNITNYTACKNLKNIIMKDATFPNITSGIQMFMSYPGAVSGTQFAPEYIDISGVDFDSAKNLAYMFRNCEQLTEVDASNIKATEATSIVGMFQNCTGLTDVTFAGAQLPKVQDFSYMFDGCTSLETVDMGQQNDGTMMDVSAAVSMKSMFQNCTALKNLDVSGFGKLDHIVNMDDFVRGCTALNTINLSNLDNSRIQAVRGAHSADTVDSGAAALHVNWGRQLGLESCTSLEWILAENSKVWLARNAAGVAGNGEYYASATDVFLAVTDGTRNLLTRNQIDYYQGTGNNDFDTSSPGTPTTTIETKRDYVDMVTDWEQADANNKNYTYDINQNGPGFLPSGDFHILSSDYEQLDPPYQDTYYRMTGVTKDNTTITTNHADLETKTSAAREMVVTTSKTHEEWTANGTSYVIENTDNSPVITVTFKDAAEDVNGKKHTVVLKVNKITFTNVGNIPASTDDSGQGRLHDPNKYRDQLSDYVRQVLQVSKDPDNPDQDRFQFLNYASESGLNYNILKADAGTDIDFTIEIEDALPNTSVLFYMDDLDVPAYQNKNQGNNPDTGLAAGTSDGSTDDACYDYTQREDNIYTDYSEGIVLGDGNDTNTVKFADYTGVVQETSSNYPGQVYLHGTGGDPSASSDSKDGTTTWSAFSVKAAASGANYTWTSGVGCTTELLRSTSAIDIDPVVIRPEAIKLVNGATPSGLYADGAFSFDLVPASEIGSIDYEYSYIEKTNTDGSTTRVLVAEDSSDTTSIQKGTATLVNKAGTADDKNTLPIVKTNSGETVSFGKLSFDKPNLSSASEPARAYIYRVKEEIPDENNSNGVLEYNTTHATYYVKVIVSDPRSDLELSRGIKAEVTLGRYYGADNDALDGTIDASAIEWDTNTRTVWSSDSTETGMRKQQNRTVAYPKDSTDAADQYPVKIDQNGVSYIAVPASKYPYSTENTGTVYLNADFPYATGANNTSILVETEEGDVYPYAEQSSTWQNERGHEDKVLSEQVLVDTLPVQVDVHGQMYVLDNGTYYAVTESSGTYAKGDSLEVEDGVFNPDTSDRELYTEWLINGEKVRQDVLGKTYYVAGTDANGDTIYKDPTDNDKVLTKGVIGDVLPKDSDETDTVDASGSEPYMITHTDGKGYPVKVTSDKKYIYYKADDGNYYSVIGTLLTPGTADFNPSDSDSAYVAVFDIYVDEDGTEYYRSDGKYYKLSDGTEYTPSTSNKVDRTKVEAGTFNNKVRTSDITVEKKTVDQAGGDSAKSDCFTYQISFTDGKGKAVDFTPADYTFEPVGAYDTQATAANAFTKVSTGVYTFQLDEGQKVFIYGVPFQTSYVISEPASGLNGWEIVDVDGDSSALTAEQTITVERVLDDGTVNPAYAGEYDHVFDNRFTELVVKKNAVGFSSTDEFDFHATAAVSGLKPLQEFSYGYMDEENNKVFKTAVANASGSATITLDDFALKHGEDIVLVLPLGAKVKVAEVPGSGAITTYSVDGGSSQAVDASGSTAEIEMNTSKRELVFTNTSVFGTFGIDVTKYLDGRAFVDGDTFSFMLTAEDGTPMPISFDSTEGSFEPADVVADATIAADTVRAQASFATIMVSPGNLDEVTVTYGDATDAQKHAVMVWISADGQTTYDPADTSVTIPDDAIGTVYEKTFTYQIMENPRASSAGDSKAVTNDQRISEVKVHVLWDPNANSGKGAVYVSAADGGSGFVTNTDATDATLRYDSTNKKFYDTSDTEVDFDDPKLVADAQVFTNIYDSEKSWTPQATKALEGRTLAADEFTFNISVKEEETLAEGYSWNEATPLPSNADADGIAQSIRQKADGTVSFKDIEYTNDLLAKTVTYAKATAAEKAKVISWTSADSTTIYGPIPDDATADITVDGVTATGVKYAEATDAQRKAAQGNTTASLWKLGGVQYIDYAEADPAIAIPDDAKGVFYDTTRSFTYTISEAIPDDAKNADGKVYSEATDAEKAAGGFAKDGIVYDASTKDVKVTITENKDGTLSVTSAPAVADLKLTNKAIADVTISVTKDIEGADWDDSMNFWFALAKSKITDAAGTDTTSPSDADMHIDGLTLRQAATSDKKTVTWTLSGFDASAKGKTYTYTISELDPGLSSVIAADWELDSDEHTVTVSFDDDLTPTVKYDGVETSGFTITNLKKGHSRNIHATKAVTDGSSTQSYWKNGDAYTLVLEPAGGISGTTTIDAADVPMPAGTDASTNTKTAEATKAEPSVNFGAIAFDETVDKINALGNGESIVYTYLIYEQIPDDALNAAGTAYSEADDTTKAAGGFVKSGVTYDSTVYHAQVTVKRDASGNLQNPEITYDVNGDGTANQNDKTYPVIGNVYQAETTLALKAKKVLDGGNLADFTTDVGGTDESAFSFTLYESDGTTVAKNSNGSQITGLRPDLSTGTVDLGSLKFTQADVQAALSGSAVVKNYYLKEDIPADDANKVAGIDYDTLSQEDGHLITVTLTVNDNGSITAVAAAHDDTTSDDQTAGIFATATNTYDPTTTQVFGVHKWLDNRPITRAGFDFTLAGIGQIASLTDNDYAKTAQAIKEGSTSTTGAAPMPGTTASAATRVNADTVNYSTKGSATFGAIPYSMDNLANGDGSYDASRIFVYKITEKKGPNSSIVYEDDTTSIYYAFVTLTNNVSEGKLETSTTYVKAESTDGGSSWTYNELDASSDDLTTFSVSVLGNTVNIDAVSFTNVYNAEGEAVVTAIKQINGREWTSEDSFSFTIEPYESATVKSFIGGGSNKTELETNEVPLPGNDVSTDRTNVGGTDGKATGTATIEGRDVGNREHFTNFEETPITYTDDMLDWSSNTGLLEGTFFYKITENTPVPTGFEQTGTTTFYAQVEVTDNRLGGLTTRVYYYSDEANVGNTAKEDRATPVFQNTYTLSSYAVIPVTKEISGRNWKTDDSFTFTIDNVNTAPLPASKNLVVDYSDVSATPAQDATPRTDSYSITLKPTDLTETTTADGQLTYSTTFTAEEADVYNTAHGLSGDDAVSAGDAKPVPANVSYGTFRYEIIEQKHGETHDELTYAKDPIYVEVLAIDNLAGGIDTQLTYYKDDSFADSSKIEDATFVNVFDTYAQNPAQILIRKDVTESDGSAHSWASADSYTFNVTALDGAPATVEFHAKHDELVNARAQNTITIANNSKAQWVTTGADGQPDTSASAITHAGTVSIPIKMSNLKTDASGKPVDTVFAYRIAEQAGSVHGVTYDTAPIFAKITAKPQADGTLMLDYAYYDNVQFSGEPLSFDSGNGADGNGNGVVITNTFGTTELTVKKIWNDGKEADDNTDRPNITIRLTQTIDGTTETLTSLPQDTNGTSAMVETAQGADVSSYYRTTGINVEADKLPITFKNLPAFTADGKEITYSATEVDPTSVGYRLTNTETSADGATVTFTNTLLTNVPVTKVWHDGNDTDARPAAVVAGLVVGGDEFPTSFKTIQPDASGTWSTSFDNLLAFDAAGTPIEYTVRELGVPSTYASSMSGDAANGYVITNTKLEDVTVEKTWVGGAVGNVELQLYRTVADSPAAIDGGSWNPEGWELVSDAAYTFPAEAFEYKTADEGGSTQSYTFSKLPAFDEQGLAYTYRVLETTQSNYFTANQTTDLAVTNTNNYTATGTANPNVVKELAGRDWMDSDSFYFKIEGTGVTDETGASIDGAVAPLPMSGTDVADIATVKASDAQVGAIGRSVDFAAITYTNEDMLNADGSSAAKRNFNYKIYEVNADGTPVTDGAGITYDTSEHTLRVEVTDNGDGTLSTSRYWDGSDNSSAVPVFTNTYSSAGDAIVWIEKKIETRDWTDSDAFTFTITGVSGASINIGGASAQDSYTTRPMQLSDEGDLQQLSATEVAMGVKGNRYTSDMLINGDANFIYALTEDVGDVADLSYDARTIYLRLHVTDNWDGTLSFEARYFEDAACTKEIVGREVWIKDTWMEGVEQKRLLSSDEAALAEAMSTEEQTAAGYRKVNVAYFINTTTADIPVTKVWTDGPAVEDVTVHLQRALFPLDVEDQLTAEYVEQNADWKLVGLTHTFMRGEFVDDQTEASYTFEDLPMYVTEEDTTYRAVYKLTEDNTSDAYAASYADQIYINAGNPTVTNTVKATNTANIAAVKQLLGRSWLSTDDFAFTLEPLGKAKYKADGSFDAIEQTTNIPMPVSDDGRISTTTGSTATTHATSNTSVVDTEGRLERLARFGAITYTVDDLVYDPTDQHHQGDFFYTMREVVPAEGEGIEGVAYSTKESTVHVKVRENRTNNLTVQIAYDETKQGDISTGTQFTPVFTNVYNSTSEASVFVVKQLVGRDWQDGDSFDFTITPVSGTKGDGTTIAAGDMPVPAKTTATASATTDPVGENEHNAEFEPITISLSDLAVDPADGVTKASFTYRVAEVVPSDTGDITYTSDTHEVTIYATSNGNGEISTSVSWDGRPVGDFVPVYVNRASVKITVTRDPANGQDTTSETVEKCANEPEQPQDPYREGYKFGGWDRTQDEDGNVTYTARWEKIPEGESVVITYNYDDGSTPPTQTTIERGENEPAQPTNPTREGYIFSGWQRTQDENGNVEYKATWTPVEKITITHDPGNGEPPTTVEIERGQDEPAQPADPVREGYSFSGWDRTIDENGNVIYKARWTPLGDDTITVSHDPGNGEPPTTVEIERGSNEPAQPADPVREGYKFGGWDRTQDEDGNVIYTARWIENPSVETITITYDPDNGQDTSTSTIERGQDEPAQPADPEREGYIFGGWERSQDEQGNVIYKAKWLPVDGSVVIRKLWDDANNQDGKRPASVEVELLANGEVAQRLSISDQTNWVSVLSGLPMVDEGGVPISYSVREAEVAGYTNTISGNISDGFVITNTHVPETTSIVATKQWTDEPQGIGTSMRDDVVLHLYGSIDGRLVYDAGSKTIPVGQSEASWTNQPVYYNGKALIWTISEDALLGYTTSIASVPADGSASPSAELRFTVTNSFTEPISTITAAKVWQDDNNRDGKRPESVTFELWKKTGSADAVKVEEQTVSAAQEWKYSWTDLPVSELVGEGDAASEQPVLYTVREAALSAEAGYRSCIQSTEPGVFSVMNYRPLDTTNVLIRKAWADNNNSDGLRPDYIAARLLADGTPISLEILAEQNNWETTVKDLPRNASGLQNVPIRYTVEELAVVGYTAAVSGDGSEENPLIITNTREISQPLSVRATKIWEGDTGLEATRPDVNLHLMKVVEGTGPVEVEGQTKVIPGSATGEALVAIWTDLPSMENGKHVTYTVTEDVVAGYTSSISNGTVNDNVISIEVTNTRIETPEPERIVITYTDGQGNTIEGWPQTIERGANEPAQPADPVREGYKFVGWQRTTDPASGNVTYTAKWEPVAEADTITVTYRDGDNVLVEQTITRGDDEPTAPEQPTKAGYSFAGWERSVDENGNVTYTATWNELEGVEPRVIYVDPKVEEGNSVLAATKYTSQAEADEAAEQGTGKPQDPSHDGLVFVGWVKGQDEFGDYVFVANYNEVVKPSTKTVSFVDPQGNELIVKSVETDNPTSVEAPPAPEHEGMEFVGWESGTDANGNTIYAAKYRCSKAPADDSYWIVYEDPATGRIIKEKTTVAAGEKEPSAPANPTRDGFEFDGWNRSVDEEGNITYTARWRAVEPVADTAPIKAVDSVAAVATNHVNTYTITQLVSSDATVVDISDTIDKVLGFVSTPATVKVTCEGLAIDANVSIQGQTLNVRIADATALRGKTVLVSFQAVVRDGADLSAYTSADKNIAVIPNTATTTINEDAKNRSHSSNTVNLSVALEREEPQTVVPVTVQTASPTPVITTTATPVTQATTVRTGTAKTGDETNFALIAGLLVAGAAVLLGARKLAKNREEDEK